MTRNNSHRRIVGGWAVGFLALLSTVGFASPAQAAPRYQDSEPRAGSSVQTAPDSVTVTFSEPLDESSTMSVENSCGDGVDGGNVTVELNEMRVSVTEGHYSGTYTVNYTAVGIGGVTGKDAGSFTFDVAEGHPCDDGGGKHPKKHDPKKHDPKKHDPKKHDPKEHDPKEHDPGKHGEGHDGDEDHDGTAHGDGDHSGTSNHDSMSGSGHSPSHRDGSGSHQASDSDGHGAGDHGDMNGNDGSAKGTFASGPLPKLPADAQAALIALVLCAALGVIGGMFLRSATD